MTFIILLGYGLREGRNGEEKDVIKRRLRQRRRVRVRTRQLSDLTFTEYSEIPPRREIGTGLFTVLSPKSLDTNLLVYISVSTSATTKVRGRRYENKFLLIFFLNIKMAS